MARGVFPIAWKEALDGSKLALENAKRLAEDAEVLRQNLRFESAFWVSLNAWEELGKAALLFRHWKQRQDVDENEWFRVLCNHRMKRAAYVQNLDVLYPKSTPPKPMKEMLEQLKKASTEWQKHFDLERQIGLYVDWVGKWRSPCKLPRELFSSFPFDSDYWITNTGLSALNFESLISDSTAKPT